MADNLWLNLFRQGPASAGPSSPDFQGDSFGLYYETDTDKLKFFATDGWREIGGATSSGATYPEVATWADLPAAADNSGDIYVVQTTTGIIGFRKLAGLWRSDGANWNYLGLYGRNASEIVNVPAGSIAATDVQAAINELDAEKQPLSSILTDTTAIFTTAKDTKLSGIATGATVNATDADLRDRATHTGQQAISTVTGLQAALDGKQPAGSYASSAHTHIIADVTGLQTTLDGKSAVGHSHVIADVTGLQTALDGKQAAGSYAAASHTHTAANITDFSEAVDDRVATLLTAGTNITLNYNDASNTLTINAASGGSPAWGSITGTLSSQTDLQTALNGKQPLATVLTNTTASFTTALETKLNGIASGATANDTDANLKNRANHTGTQAAATITGLATVATTGSAGDLTGNLAVARLNGGTGASASTFWRGDGQWAAPTGGSDPWTYIKLSSDFVTSSATAVDVTGLAFTPAANTQYEFEVVLLLRTATATVGPRPGLAWATGMTDGVANLFMPTSATAQVLVFGNINAALLAAVGGLPNTTQSYPARISGTVLAGASPSGTVKVQLASETGGTNVTAKTGSFIRYRSI